jgi:hypothetical protein
MNKGWFGRLVVAFVIVLAVAWSLLFLMMGARGGVRPGAFCGSWPFYLATLGGLVTLFIAIGLGMFVYRDAKERGMEPLLWALVAALVPYFVGLVVYLVVRGTRQVVCPSCGRHSADSAFCPACGHPLRAACRSCGKPVRNGPAFCPHCGVRLGPESGTAS